MTERAAPTYPHDYRLIAGGDVKPTIIGGQAVNLWAIALLEPDTGAGLISTKYASGDMDILAAPKIVEFLKTLEPDWRVEKVPFKIFGHGLEARAHGLAEDNRLLLVEVLNNVKGLDEEDLAATELLSYAGVEFKVLDPIAMLKAKAANVRDLDQLGPPPRHDVQHLHLIVRCVPEYLRRAHGLATERESVADRVAKTFSRAFQVLTNRKTRDGLAKAQVDPTTIIPPEFANSPIAAIRNAYVHQFPRVRGEKR